MNNWAFFLNLDIWPPAPRVLIYSTNPHQLFCLYRYRNTVKVCPVYVLLGYFVLSNDPNWEVVRIKSIFGIIFGTNQGIWVWPPGFPYMGLLLTVMQLISNRYNRAFVCYKMGCIWGIFGQNIAHI